jgi:hypothetical protein
MRTTPSPALAVASLALAVALGGAAYAAIPDGAGIHVWKITAVRLGGFLNVGQ